MNIEADVAENVGFTPLSDPEVSTHHRSRKRRSTDSELEGLTHLVTDGITGFKSFCDKVSEQIDKFGEYFSMLKDDHERKAK